MSNILIQAETRDTKGTANSRRLRRLENKIPAIIYGKKLQPQNIQVEHKDIIKACENEAFFSQIIDLKVGEKRQQVILKDMQRHPYKPKVLHMDFLRIDKNDEIIVQMPLHFINTDICHGVKQEGGTLIHALNSIEIACLPKDLPEYIEVDVANLKLNETRHIHEIVLPEGVRIPLLAQEGDHDLAIAKVMKIEEQTDVDVDVDSQTTEES